MKKFKFISILGSVVLIVGTFTPIVKIPLMTKTLIPDYGWLGYAVLGAGVLGMVGHKYLSFLAGASAMALLGYQLSELWEPYSKIQGTFLESTGMFKPLEGWIPLIAGSLTLTLSVFIPVKKKK